MAIRFHFGEHEHTDIVAQPVIFFGNPEVAILPREFSRACDRF
jgi:hypothetical protein